ncbi:hypothetical protein [Actinomadura sp. K4S16]|uniref:hypothetical protein n=1 Tax=Actinomadura sp. K4S16 TaxID=1316147 RepID=UPI0011EF6328|nr:hypothetical protein [Actinomadura sp. K4S16]
MRPPATLADLPVYAMNLPRRTDRWEALTRHMALRGLPAPVQVPAVDGPAVFTPADLTGYRREVEAGFDGDAACYGQATTALNLLTSLAEDPPDWTLILEDDAVFHEDVHARYAEFAALVPDDALVVLLGCVHKSINRRYRPAPGKPHRSSAPVEGTGERCWRAGTVWCCHAFMASREAVPLLLEAAKPRAMSFDLAWNAVHHLGRTYLPNPHLAIQRPGDWSDIQNTRRGDRPEQFAPRAQPRRRRP